MAVSSINGQSNALAAYNPYQFVSSVKAAQASQQGIAALSSSSLTGASSGSDAGSSLNRLVQFSGTSTLTLILADQEKKNKGDNNITDALFALIAYQATNDFFTNSAATLSGTVQGVSSISTQA